VAKIAVFVDHDIVLRHFLLSGVLPVLEAEHEVVWIFPDRHRRVTIDPATLPLGRYRTIAVSETRLHGYRRLYHATVLRRLRRSRDKGPIFAFWREALGRRSFWTSWCWSWPGTYHWYRRRMLARIGDDPVLDALLQEEKPDVLVHPTVLEGLFVSDLIRWGRVHHVPTVYLMNSWDNPAVKAVAVGAPDRLVVWGEHSRQVANERLGVPLEHLLPFGAAQFDVYRRPPREAPAAYRARLGVPADRRLLLYAGSSKGLDETAHLLALEQAIERGELRNCSVLYRPHPWRASAEGEADFFALRWRHVAMAPDMAEYYRRHRERSGIIHLADYEDTHVTLAAVDAVISPLSTILLEAALHGKPILAYLPDEDVASNMALFSMARTVHFRDFFERVDCLQCLRPEALVGDCRALLERAERPETASRLRRQCEYFVAPSERSYAERLDDLIRSLASSSLSGVKREV
jgi:CDP-glycerol:poly(glycerophosphate) glycerophosphotransferase